MARRASRGFSLIELLVALVFTMILMAGMGVVFKAGLSTFYTSGEKISSMRRNRVTADVLYDDLNTAGLSMVDITSALSASADHPAFFIIPNVAVKDSDNQPITTPDPGDPVTTDELYLAFDQPLPFDGQLVSGGGAGTTGRTAGGAVLANASFEAGTDDQYVIDCGDADYAKQVKVGMYMHIKDDLSHSALRIASATPSGVNVTVTVDASPTLGTQVTGRGDSGALRPNQRIDSSSVIFIRPSQMIRYRIVMMRLDPDPAKTKGIPCLVREQATYDPTSGFSPSDTQLVTENVAGFKVYLSADSGQNWAGWNKSYTEFANGWTNGIQAELDSQLVTLGRVGYTSTGENTSWYRDIPVLMRADITTRTATQRSEYASTPTSLAYKTFTQSLVLVPRHFGLTMK
ncbi:PilW family protein [Holophaga foetida]|uniref:PilW family protein n=1 Tax=Holophaga foetida TaxID=35839 RepID=UPI000247505F|nr:prepilin-type N-terminal cleavage/methylation domain-containing protein [Holophaga foetida]